MLKTTKRLLLSYWLPVVLMIMVIATESTEMFGANETGGLIYPIVNWITLHVTGHPINYRLFELIHALLRKTGHLTGYGLLCAVWFRAIRGTARQHTTEIVDWNWFWNAAWARKALLMTALIASADEIHQTMLPSRTGTYKDVLIDTTGAILTLSIAYMLARRSFRREQSRIFQLT